MNSDLDYLKYGCLTPGWAAEVFGVDLATVEAWISDGLPSHTLGEIRFIWKEDIKEFLATRGTHTDDAPSGESTGTVSVLVAEEYMCGFFG